MSLQKQTLDHAFTPDGRRQRQGTACIEFAVLSPLLVLIILGIIEVGQFVNVGQSVSNSSREGARVAARQSTTNVSQVVNAVTNYLTDMHPNLPSSAVQVTVTGAGGPVTGANIASVATGTPITVQVVVQFDPVRWVNGLPLLDGRAYTETTITRRE